ncbi:MAG: MgtC/SapB family protein [Synechococcaceae cyanobacterium ELA445]
MQLSSDLEALLRMGLAVACGLAMGYNRAHTPSHRRSRLRVHVLVGLSSCLMVLAAGQDTQAHSRVIQGVATGVGFLGAGEILRSPVPDQERRGQGETKEDEESWGQAEGPVQVRGLTSAASIWFTAALGLTVATTTPLLALVALALALVVLSQTENGNQPP